MTRIKKEVLFEFIMFLISIFAIIIYYHINNWVAAITFILLSIGALIFYKIREGTFIKCKTIFTFVYFFTIGLSMMQLHHLQTTWKVSTFIVLELSYCSFLIGYYIKDKRNSLANEKEDDLSLRKVLVISNIIFYFSIIALTIEVIIRGGFPLFSKDMSAYYKFGVTGIHYFTVASVLYLPLAFEIITSYKLDKKKISIISIKSIICILIPILIVSRQLLIMEICLVLFLILKKWTKQQILIILVGIIILSSSWFLIGKNRNQNDQYLRQALQIQDNAPMSVSNMNIYMYIAFNYDNLNYNIGRLTSHTYGYKSLYPIFALSGTKFILDEKINSNLERVVNVFTTYPIQMTPYQDFGLLGVVIYMLVIGAVCHIIESLNNNPINETYKSIIMYCLLFSFFSAFFSFPMIVFNMLYLFVLSKIKVGEK